MRPISPEQREEFADYPEENTPGFLRRKKKTDRKFSNERGII
jgi:hypothetical protein